MSRKRSGFTEARSARVKKTSTSSFPSEILNRAFQENDSGFTAIYLGSTGRKRIEATSQQRPLWLTMTSIIHGRTALAKSLRGAVRPNGQKNHVARGRIEYPGGPLLQQTQCRALASDIDLNGIKPPPIAILGAGPSGLTFARLLEINRIDYEVFERSWGASEKPDTRARSTFTKARVRWLFKRRACSTSSRPSHATMLRCRSATGTGPCSSK